MYGVWSTTKSIVTLMHMIVMLLLISGVWECVRNSDLVCAVAVSLWRPFPWPPLPLVTPFSLAPFPLAPLRLSKEEAALVPGFRRMAGLLVNVLMVIMLKMTMSKQGRKETTPVGKTMDAKTIEDLTTRVTNLWTGKVFYHHTLCHQTEYKLSYLRRWTNRWRLYFG